MKIGVDATCWENKRGFGRFTRDLMTAVLEIDSENEYLFFTDASAGTGQPLPAAATSIAVRTSAPAIEAAAAGGRRSLGDLAAMSRAVLRHELDVFFFPTVYSYFPVFNRTKVVVTVHDVIAEHHPKLIFPNRKSKFFWNLKQRLAMRRADIVATVSDYSRRQIMEYFGTPGSAMRVIPEAARPIFKVLPRDEQMTATLARLDLEPDEKFLLYVGGISPHKNLDTLIGAFGELAARPDAEDAKLLLVGDYENDSFFSAYPALKKLVAEMRLRGKVVFTGFVPDDDLVALYNAASVLVFPSLEEGFGLPAIEAMACGTPVAASSSGSLPEVVGAAGEYFDPLDVGGIADVLARLLSDDAARAAMKSAGLVRARAFTWQRAAAETIAMFEELAHGAGRRESLTSTADARQRS